MSPWESIGNNHITKDEDTKNQAKSVWDSIGKNPEYLKNQNRTTSVWESIGKSSEGSTNECKEAKKTQSVWDLL